MFKAEDIRNMEIQQSQRDWETDLSDEAATILEESGLFFSFVLGDKVLAVGGVAIMGQGPMFLCVLSDEATRRSKTLYLYALAALRVARENGFDWLFTHTDAGDDVQARWVSRLGFEPKDDQRLIGGRKMIYWEMKL